MTTILLIIIYIAFISLGLPDPLLGAAWPMMYPELHADVSWAGIISMIISAGTILSSLASDRLNQKFGTGRVTAFSVAMTAVALFGFSTCHAFWMLCLWAIPYGLGAGGVDAALNNYVALHYPARHMSWLHCMWGVGTSVGPMVMSWALTGGFHWNGGFRAISYLQIALTVILFVTLPLWRKVPVREMSSSKETQTDTGSDSRAENAAAPKKSGNNLSAAAGKERSLPQLIRRPGVKEVLICFFCYCALETTAGMWAASYCSLYRGISVEEAARWASLFYIGITVGRFVCGFLTYKINDRNMIRLGQFVSALGILLILLPLGNALLLPGLVLVGCGCAPVYPSIIHETPENFGADLSQAIIGVQMAAAYTGTCLIPPLFGLLAQYVNVALYPFFLAAILILMIVMSELLHKKTAK